MSRYVTVSARRTSLTLRADRRGGGRWWLLSALVCLLAWGGVQAFAQPLGVGEGLAEDDESGEPAGEEGSVFGTAAINEVALRVIQFGAGQAARSGDWFGLQVEVVDSGAKARNVLVRLSLHDPDGDVANIERTAVINPGVKQSVWLYARVPSSSGFRSTLDIRAFEAEAVEGGGSAAGQGEPGGSQSYGAGRLLGRTQYPIVNLLPSYVATWALVGDRPAGLEQVSGSRLRGRGFDSAPPNGHVHVELARGLVINALPDRWMGLAQFELLAWTPTSREQPSQLSEFQAGAIKEWVARGGHMVVIMPAAGQPWIGAGATGNPLADIMPTVSVTRVEGVDLEAYRRLLTRDPRAKLPGSAIVQRFTPKADSDAFSAMPVLVGPEGETVVVRRLVGAGCVTLVGLDLSSSALTDAPGALQADVFWNRLLGRRSPAFSASELAAEDNATGTQTIVPRYLGAADLDAGVSGLIQMQGQAAAGLLMAFVVFGAYWLVAGPLSYFGLKAKGKRHHSWVAFAGATAVFTAVAWLGATVLKGTRVEARHLTVVDHVYGQTNQRARCWLNMYFPTYGDEPVSVGSEGGFHNVLSPWEAADSRSGGSGSFPDNRGYTVDARWPATLPVPVRATAKPFQVDWAGVLPPSWNMPRPVVKIAAGEPGDAAASAPAFGSEIRVVPRQKQQPNERDWALSGSISHKLPGPLEDVTVIVNIGQNGSSPRRFLFADMYAHRITGLWQPDVPLELGDDAPKDSFELALAKDMPRLRGMQSFATWLDENNFNREGGSFLEAVSESDTRSGLVYSSFLSAMDVSPTRSGQQAAWIRQNSLHGFDLSRWVTQPCIIIIGRVDHVDCPLPLTVDGEPLPTGTRNTGSVLVRWVYPLAPKPHQFAASADEAVPAESGAQPGETDVALPPGSSGG